MTVVTVTAQNIRLDDAEATTDWGSIGGGAGRVLESDYKYQGSNCISRKGATAQRGFFLSDNVDTDISPTGTYQTVMFKFICTTPGLLDLLSVPGMRLEIGSGSITPSPSVNFHFYDVQGRDTYPLTTSWLVLPIDPNVASHRTGTTGTPALTLADYFALRYDQTGTSKAENQALDAVDIGAGLTLVNGDGADPDGVWQDFINHDEGIVANRFGYVRTIEGIVLVYGMMVIGTATATVFNDTGVTIVFPDGLFAASFSGITVDLQNATTDVDFKDSNFFANGTETGEDTRPVLIVTGIAGDFAADGCVFDTFASLTLTSACTLLNCIVSNSGAITQAGAFILTCKINGSTVGDGAAALISDAPSAIRNTEFTFSDGHAIEITQTGTYAFRGNTFSGYGADGTNDAAIYNNSGGLVTLNITSGGDIAPTVRNGSGASTVLNATANVTFSGMLDDTEVRIYDSGTGVEIAGIENATAGSPDDRSFTWNDVQNNSVDYVIHNVARAQTIRVEAFKVPLVDTTIPIQQVIERNYDNP